uniref:Uncharacterized protein n=1 Tax=Trepomonas sp. PC1 TaxID=1076344 RepID=A0A146K565_9EUKA|eukprot:JAP91518.1 Hypothetical protein TPC1_16848 [Trepomonas sp. PC1]
MVQRLYYEIVLQPQIENVNPQSKPNDKAEKRELFHWDAQLDTKFCVVAMAIGWDRVEPKQIIQYLGSFKRTVIASHLQKLRNQMKREVHKSFNYTIPAHLMSPVFKLIQKHWRVNKNSMSQTEIMKLLNYE